MSFLEVLFHYSWFQYAFIAGVLSSVASGITGPLVISNRLSYLSGGMAHGVLGGMGIAHFFNLSPLLGGGVFACLMAFLMSIMKTHFKENEDVLISAFWTMGMSIGLIFIFLTPGYQVNLFSFLFGNILIISKNTLMLLGILDIVILSVLIIFYRQIMLVSFDQDFALVRGIRSHLIYLLILLMISLTIITLVFSVGLILVIALMTIPASISKLVVNNFFKMMLCSFTITLVTTILGFLFSYQYNLPTGATIVLILSFLYFLSFFILRKKLKRF